MIATKKQNFFSKCGNAIKSFFVCIGRKIKERFKYISPLVGMQLKDKMDFSGLKNKKNTFFKIIWKLVLYIVIILAITLFFEILIKFSLFSYLPVLNFRAFLILMTFVLFLSFISCLTNVTTTLYFSKDNPVLLTMPVKNSTIFSSKMIVCFVYELIKNISYILPFFIAYGIVMSLPFTYYLWIIGSILFLTLFFVILSGLLSIPAMAITIAFKQHKILEFVILFTLVGMIVFVVVKAIIAIPTDIDLIRDWGKIYWELQALLESFAITFAPLDYFLQLLTGMGYYSYVFTPFSTTNLITFSICVGVILLSLLAIYFLSKPLFLRMASTPFEYKKNSKAKPRKNKVHSTFISATYQHSKQIFRSANLIYEIVVIAIITPIAILLQNKIIGAMDTRLSGEYMGIAFNILILLLLMLSSNNILASIFSREGNSAYLNKVNPVPYSIPLSGKLVLNAIISCVSIVISVIVITLFANIKIFGAILLCLTIILIYLSHLLWSAELDIMNPQNQEYQTTGKSQKNPNENKSVLIGFMLSAIFAFVAYFLMSENINVVFIKLFFIALILFGVRLYLYLTKIKLYYKEKAV